MSGKSEERSAIRKAVAGLSVVAVVMAVALNLSNLSSLVGSANYDAKLNDGGGIRKGDDVRVDGINVGKVTGLQLAGRTVKLDFEASGIKLGDESRLFIRSDNALGRKYVDLDLAGAGDVKSIPESRTEPGYAITEVLGELTTTTEQLDTKMIEKAFNSFSTVLDGSAEEFGSALTGVEKLSKTISDRDSDLNRLLEKANSVSGVLAQRNKEITDIFGRGSAIFQELLIRQTYVSALFDNVQAATQEIETFVKENKKKMPSALTKLREVANVLAVYRTDLASSVVDLSAYVRGLGDAIGSGPFFHALVANLTQPESLVTGAPGSLLGGNN